MSAEHPHGSAGHGSADHGHDHGPTNFLTKYVFSTDHKTIGIQFLLSSLAWLFVGGGLALALRWQLAYPWQSMPLVGARLFPESGGTIPPQFYNMLFTMHASVMIFLVIIPMLLGAFANYLIPLQIGARDMAFPRLNMAAYWMMWPAYLCFGASFFVVGGAATDGWTAYPPLSLVSKDQGQTLWLLGVTFAGLSSMMGAINYMTTIVTMRAPGMTMMRMPLSVWSLLITSFLQAFALPALTAAGLLQLSDRLFGTVFFQPGADGAGGSPILWQHLFWFYSHPAVYVMVLPAMGIVSEVLSTFSRKPVFGYKPMVIAMSSIALIGFVVWGHHMFTSGMSTAASTAFMLSTVLISVPSAIKTFNWLATVHGGRIQFTAPMLHALGFVTTFVIGGLSGIALAEVPVDVPLHDTYYVVAHFHFILAGSTLFGIFAGVTYWFPKMFGKLLNEPLGKLHFLLTFVFVILTFIAMHQLGEAGQTRRIADPNFAQTALKLQPLHKMMTHAAIGMGFAQVLLVVNILWSLCFGKPAGANPWKANGLEWTAPSPPPHGNFGAALPVVYRGPHEFSHPDCDADYWPQTAPPNLRFADADQTQEASP